MGQDTSGHPPQLPVQPPLGGCQIERWGSYGDAFRTVLRGAQNWDLVF
jgi:hypothetical protein